VTSGPDRGSRLLALEKENLALEKRLARMSSNVRQMEEMQDATSKLLAGLTRELEEERARSQSLLLNILPEAIIRRLEAGEETIADRFNGVNVLFADLVGFTAISSDLDPRVLVSELNELFSRFDELCERTGVEKIKTIGDAYLAVGGLEAASASHLTQVADLALQMVEAAHHVSDATSRGWNLRIGIHSGPAVAGVIGKKKFVYDVWGDTVNVASRLEASSEPGRIHVSSTVEEPLRSAFVFEPRGKIGLKGKGTMATFFLTGRA
jgi:adenylate cyclase